MLHVVTATPAAARAVSASHALKKSRGDAATQAVEFDSRLLKGRSQGSDLSRYENGNPVEAGTYTLDVYVNADWYAERVLRFRAQPDSDQAAPCFDRADMQAFGVSAARLSDPADENACRTVAGWLPDASARYNSSKLRYDITIPQADMAKTVRGAVPRSAWSRGITAGLLQYDLDIYRQTIAGQSSRHNAFLSYMAGFNIGGWQLRSDQIVRWNDTQGVDNDVLRTFARRPIPAIRSELTLGENFTDGRVFDSFGYRGVALAADSRMLPNALRGYAPVVRGQASSNARVEIRQNGRLIYQTQVSPGPFAIRDLYPTGYGGDLNVTVIEAGGERQRFVVPYASVPGLLRPGITDYSLVAGQYRNDTTDEPWVLQGSVRRGLTNRVTAYGGITASKGYSAIAAGAALNTPIGAFAFDVTHARTEFDHHDTESGQSYEASFSRTMSSWGTSFSLAAYRYSTSGYYELDRAVRLRSNENETTDPFYRGRERNSGQLNINQQLGQQWGSMYLTATVEDYWDRGGTTTSYQAGYRNRFKSVTYGISIENRLFADRGDETRVLLNISLPLSAGGEAPIYANTTTDFDRSGYSGSRLGLNSTLGEHRNVNWDVSVNDQRYGGTSGNGNLTYRSPLTTLRGGLSVSEASRQISAGARGSVVAHRDGLTFSPQQGDNVVLVHAEGAQGARIVNSVGAEINADGYGLVAYATPYQTNSIQLDPSGAGDDVALETTSKQVAPWAGSVTRLDFSTVVGDPVLITATTADGQTIPLGSAVIDRDSSEQIGMVGQANQVYFRSYDDHGRLQVQWGIAPAETCELTYRLDTDREPAGGLYRLTEPCRPASATQRAEVP